MTESPSVIPPERIQVRVRVLADDGVTFEEAWWPLQRLLDIIDEELAEGARQVEVVVPGTSAPEAPAS